MAFLGKALLYLVNKAGNAAVHTRDEGHTSGKHKQSITNALGSYHNQTPS